MRDKKSWSRKSSKLDALFNIYKSFIVERDFELTTYIWNAAKDRRVSTFLNSIHTHDSVNECNWNKGNWNFRVRRKSSISPNPDSIDYLILMYVVLSLDDLMAQNMKDWR